MSIQPMLCKDDLDKFIKHCGGTLQRVMWSEKLDGVRCVARVDTVNRTVSYWSRNGKAFRNFGCFDAELLVLADSCGRLLGFGEGVVAFDGEVMAAGFSNLMTQVHRIKEVDTSALRFFLFDIPTEPASSFEERQALLWAAFQEERPFRDVVHRLAHYRMGTADKAYILAECERIVKNGGEGLVLKNMDSTYQQKKSIDWCKVKLFDTLDLPVIGVCPGTGKHLGRMGALVCDLGGGKTVEVGTGFTDREREEFNTCPPKLIEVKYQERTKDSLRFPSFVRVREDKD